MRRVPRSAILAAMHEFGLPEPYCEYKFWQGRGYAFDYAWPGYKVALEVEGGMFGIGKPCKVCKRRKVAGHSSIERIKTDIEKYNQAAFFGWMVLRCLPVQVETGTIFPTVQAALDGRVLSNRKPRPEPADQGPAPLFARQ